MWNAFRNKARDRAQQPADFACSHPRIDSPPRTALILSKCCQEDAMVDALIIDACRTPRGVGKAGKGALSGIHPQQLGATVLRAACGTHRHQHRRCRRHHLGHQRPGRPAERRSGADVRARCRLRRARLRRDAGPVLRLGYHQRQHGGGFDHGGRGGSGDRGRNRDDVDGRPPRPGPDDDGHRQSAPARQTPAIASGRLRRCHRDHGGHFATGCRCARARKPEAGGEARSTRPFQQQPGAGSSRRRHARAGQGRISAAADHDGRLGRA